MDTCQICKFLPAIGVCPICQRRYCPDDVQQQQPFLLCIECAERYPNYLQTGGYWYDNNHWYDYRTGCTFNLEKAASFKDTREIWLWVEELFHEDGMDLWKIAEQHFQELNSKENVAISRMRRLGCFEISEAFDLANNKIQEDDLESANEILDLIFILDPANPNVSLVRGDIYRKAGKYHKAIEEYSRVIKTFPKDPYGYYRRAVVNLFDLGNDEIGLKDLKVLEKLEKRAPQILFSIGVIFARRQILFGEHNAAKPAIDYLSQALTQAIAMNVEMPEIFPIRGHVYLMSGNHEAANNDFIIANRFYDDMFDISMFI